MLEDAFRGLDDGVYIQSRQDGDLFNVTHFKSRTKIILVLVRELLFADNIAVLAHSPEAIQRIVTSFSEASKRFGLKTNIKKTDVLYHPNSFRTQNNITVDGIKLNSVQELTYLGSTIIWDGKMDAEIQKGIPRPVHHLEDFAKDSGTTITFQQK